MSLFQERHESFRARVRRFVEERLLPHADAWEARCECPPDVFREMGREGFLGLTYPPEYGGQGLDFAYNVVLAEELPRCRMAGLTLSVLAQTNFFLPLLARLGTDYHKREFMAPSIRGEKIGALASTEPSGGSDITGATRCTAIDDGDCWIISGEKVFITNGPIADFVIALVRTRKGYGPNGFSLVIVPADTPGFRVKQSLRKLGLNTSPTGWLEFDACHISKTLTLGKPHLGYFYHTQNLLEERLIGGVSSTALAGLVLEDAISHLKEQGHHARPQAVRHRISEMAAEIEMARRFVHSVCERYRDGKTEAKEICMIKFHVTEIVQRTIESCLQLYGGVGTLEDHWVGRSYRDARVLSLGGGTSEIMKDLVATYLHL